MSKDYDKTVEQTLQDGESMTITVGGGISGRAIVQVDDGTTDAIPAAYDLVSRVEGEPGEFMFFDALEGVTHRSVQDPLWEDRLQYELTNVSGGAATYRMRVVGLDLDGEGW